MDFNSYIVSETKTAASLPLAYAPHNYKIKKAFTLAEVLITLTIIGVIAAMTVPTLLSNNQKHTYVVGLKKAYATLSNAVQMIPLSEGCSAGDWECAGLLDETATNIDGQDFGGSDIKNLTIFYQNNSKHQV